MHLEIEENPMENGQPPSWRPDVEQFRAEVCRGTVRDALGGLRNLEQLLASLRVGPRALSSVLPDVRSSCPAFADAIDGLVTLVIAKLVDAEGLAPGLRQLTRARLDSLVCVIESTEQQNLNAKNRLRLQETVSSTARDLEAVVDVIDLLGEVAWGRKMALDPAEVAREAFRSGEPTNVPLPAVRLTLTTNSGSDEYTASPRALVLLLHHLVRWSVGCAPNATPVVSIGPGDSREAGLYVGYGADKGELRWVPGRRPLPLSENPLRIAASAMGLGLDLTPGTGQVRLMFASAH
jgi:hypothetical protein